MKKHKYTHCRVLLVTTKFRQKFYRTAIKTFYEKLVLRNSELRDTVFLSPTSYRLGEVVIYGIKPKNNYPKFRVDKDELDMIWYKTQPTNLLNLVKLVADKILTHGTDERVKRKRIIDNY